MTDPTTPEETEIPAILTAYWVTRDGEQGQKRGGTEDLTEELDRGNDWLRVTEEFWNTWQQSVRDAEASMNLGLVVLPMREDVLLPSRY